ncbi:MAG TPA: SDR family oxidoreductase, partial [Acidimicrobiales bacterium]|nr:SDR family oxidoreductase [Acidimicrobiales bacterium]
MVVTGATSGLGEAMADALLAEGATVAFASRPGPRLDGAVADRRARGLAALALPTDVRDPRSVEQSAAEVTDRLGGVDVVVNNAGIGMRTVNRSYTLSGTEPRLAGGPERSWVTWSPQGSRSAGRVLCRGCGCPLAL